MMYLYCELGSVLTRLISFMAQFKCDRRHKGNSTIWNAASYVLLLQKTISIFVVLYRLDGNMSNQSQSPEGLKCLKRASHFSFVRVMFVLL